jgi:hypothetical protein
VVGFGGAATEAWLEGISSLIENERKPLAASGWALSTAGIGSPSADGSPSSGAEEITLEAVPLLGAASSGSGGGCGDSGSGGGVGGFSA